MTECVSHRLATRLWSIRPGRLSRRESRLAFGMTLTVGVHGNGHRAVSAAGDVLDLGEADRAGRSCARQRSGRGSRCAVTRRPAGDEIILALQTAQFQPRQGGAELLRLTDVVPAGLDAVGPWTRAVQLDGGSRAFELRDLGDFDAGQSETLDIPVRSYARLYRQPGQRQGQRCGCP